MLVGQLLAFIYSKPDKMRTLLNEFPKYTLRSTLQMVHPSCVLGKTKQDAINAIVLMAAAGSRSTTSYPSAAASSSTTAGVEMQLVHQDQAHGERNVASKDCFVSIKGPLL